MDQNNSICSLVAQDFGWGDNATVGEGVSAEQIVRAAIIKQSEVYSYEELAFHLADSRA
ncbi:MAG: hypothetical protein M8357_10840 [Desulfobulbaceae bacterium]|nr:hypothetical protein [Desulfobulbaceae bacterium]